MDEFNFLFSLFGLLLGFAVAEVVGAFGRAFRAGEQVHVGWLTPLLGLSVLIDIASFWLSVWDLRTAIRAHLATVLVGLCFCGGYYLIALQATPPDHARWHDFDGWYWRARRRVGGGLLAINLAIFALQFALAGQPPAVTPYVVANIAYVLLLAGIVSAPGKRLNIALLSLNIGLFGLSATYGALHR